MLCVGLLLAIAMPCVSSMRGRGTFDEDAHCFMWGLSSYKTFDDTLYFFDGGDHTYTLARDWCEESFNVNVRRYGLGCKPARNCPLSVTITTKDELEIKRDIELTGASGFTAPVVRINGTVQEMPLETFSDLHLTRVSESIVVSSSGLGFTVIWDGLHTVTVHVRKSLKYCTCGLCGFYSDMMDDDMKTLNGTTVDLYNFSTSWIVDSLSELNIPKTFSSNESQSMAAGVCELLDSEEFKHCHSKVNNVDDYKEQCVDYLSTCKASEFEACKCSALSGYALECAEQGVYVNWRNETFCPASCPADAPYSICNKDCSIGGCGGLSDDCIQSEYCVAGCHCPEGAFLYGDVCTTPEQCPCLRHNSEYPNGQVFYDAENCEECYCLGGETMCMDIDCQVARNGDARSNKTPLPITTALDRFRKIDNVALQRNNVYVLYASLHECAEMCFNETEFTCLSFDYSPERGICWLQNTTNKLARTYLRFDHDKDYYELIVDEDEREYGSVSCDFEDGFCGYVFDGDMEFSWTRQTGRTKSYSTGPKYDHTFEDDGSGVGHYVYMEGSYKREGWRAGLRSPSMLAMTGQIIFYYHMKDVLTEESGTLDVYLRRKGFDLDEPVWTVTGNQGNQWHEVVIDVTPNMTQYYSFQVEFVGVRGPTSKCDIAIDDISVVVNETNLLPDPVTLPECGRPKVKRSRIVGGHRATYGDWPWMASLRIKYWSTYFHICGGSLINEQWVVTVGHCISDMSDSEINSMIIVLGAETAFGGDEHEQTFKVTDYVINPGYTKFLDNDIALIKLDQPVIFTDYVGHVCVRSYVFPPGSDCTVTGWGDTEGPASESSYLNQVEVPIIDNGVCNGPDWYAGYVSDDMVCAGYTDGGKDACQGDSGGPLVCQRSDGEYELAGLVSWGVGCADRQSPGVYTKVQSYISWIEDVIKEY